MLLRNAEDLDLNNPAITGVKSVCLLNDVENFHVTTNFALDIMHHLLDGVCGLEVHLVIADLVRAGFFDLDLLNSRITSFDYAPGDSKDKPSPKLKTQTVHEGKLHHRCHA